MTTFAPVVETRFPDFADHTGKLAEWAGQTSEHLERSTP